MKLTKEQIETLSKFQSIQSTLSPVRFTSGPENEMSSYLFIGTVSDLEDESMMSPKQAASVGGSVPALSFGLLSLANDAYTL